jgi:hypothetical protein
MLTGAHVSKTHSPEGVITYAVLNLLSGVYLIFFPKKVIRILLNEKLIEESDETANNTDFKKVGAILIKVFGVFVFYQFMHSLVTAYNLAAGNWSPGDTQASAFVIHAAFNFGLSYLLMFKTSSIIEVIFKDVE